MVELLVSIGSNRRDVDGIDASAKVNQCKRELCRLAPVRYYRACDEAPLMSFAAKGGFAASPVSPYANAVVWVRAVAPLSIQGVERILKGAEETLGRKRPAPEVEIDIDLLMFGDEVVRQRDLERDYCRIPIMISFLKCISPAMPAKLLSLLLGSVLK